MKDSKIRKAIQESLDKGWEMSKLLNAGGLFSHATYDHRTVYTIEDLYRLNDKGFGLKENTGLLALNILLKL